MPTGFVEADESPEQAAVRETAEETGLRVRIRSLQSVYGSCNPEQSCVVLIVCRVDFLDSTLAAGDDAQEVRFFPLEELPENIAFSNHRMALQKIRQHTHSKNNPKEQRDE